LGISILSPSSRRQLVPTKAVDMDAANRLLVELGEKDAEGNITLGGCKVEFKNAAISSPRRGGGTNRVVEASALRMHKETGHVIADVGGYRVVQAEELVRLTDNAEMVNAGIQDGCKTHRQSERPATEGFCQLPEKISTRARF
jgi:hypothetical protein